MNDAIFFSLFWFVDTWWVEEKRERGGGVWLVCGVFCGLFPGILIK